MSSAGDNSIIPKVTFLLSTALRNKAGRFVEPCFRIVDPHCADPRQASFSPYSYRWSAEPPSDLWARLLGFRATWRPTQTAHQSVSS